MRCVTACFALLLLAIAVPGESQGLPRELTQPDVEPWLDGYFPNALARADIAGAAVVVVKDGAVIAQRGYGHADTANGSVVDPARTLFRTGSVGKLFTWTAVMQLVEAGRLDLDRDVNDYLDFRIAPREGGPVTLRNLMTHTPGFEEVLKNLVVDAPDELPTIEQYVKTWTPTRIYPPGKIPAYSNYGATLAGYIVQRVSGESFDDYVDRHVFAPLGMFQSTTRQPLPAHLADQVAKGYVLGSGPAMPFELFGVSPAGGASATAADMARFMLAYLQEGRLGTARLLRADTVHQMLGTRLPIVPPLNSMLLGFFEETLNDRRIVGHRGDTQFFHSTLNLLLDEGVGVFLVINSTGRDDAAYALPTAFINEFADRYFPAPADAGSVIAEVAAEHARLMAGTYMSSRRQESNFLGILNLLTQMRVTQSENGGLLVPALLDFRGQPMQWREVAPFVWHQVGGKERLAARVENGRVVMFSFDYVSPFVVMLPAPWWMSVSLLAPAIVVAVSGILALIAAWPVGALIRRRYGAASALTFAELWVYRWLRLAGIAALALLVCWTALVAQIESNAFAFTPRLDVGIFLLRVLTLIVLAGGTVAALGNARLAWAKRGWASGVWSLVLVFSFAVLSWSAAIFGLAGVGSDY